MSHPGSNEALCSFGGSSYTLPTSNQMVLDGFELSEQLDALQTFALPARFLLPFLHEVTHRYCFRLKVGTALSLLSLRARRASLAAAIEGSPGAAIEDARKYAAALAFLRPLAEGLALFAEFEALPGDSSANAGALAWATILFAAARSLADPDVIEFQVRRERAAHWKRKELLLSQPIGGHGGYLAGHLATRVLWLFGSMKAPEFSDRSLLLAFLTEYFFDDPVLVVGLLEMPAAKFEDWLPDYFRQRLEHFRTQLQCDWAHEYPAWVARRTPAGYAPWQRERTADVDAARARIQEHFNTLGAPTIDTETLLGRSDLSTLVARELVWLGQLQPARLEGTRAEGITARLNDGRVVQLEWVAAPTEGELRLGAIAFPDQLVLGLVALTGTTLVGFKSLLGSLDGAARSRYLPVIGHSAIGRPTDVAMYEFLVSTKGDPAVGAAMRASTERMTASAVAVLSGQWLDRFPHRSRAEVDQNLYVGGFAAIPGLSVKELALLSTAYGFHTDEQVASVILDNAGLEPDAVYERTTASTVRLFGKSLLQRAGPGPDGSGVGPQFLMFL